MKIKDNLNLNGYILQNFCIDNYDSLDGINDKNKGRAVFLTGNGTNAGYGHVNVYDGTSFKALAYVDDVANNEEFRALQSKVNTIDTMLNVDSAEGVVSTWQEIQAFLDQIGEDKDLMDMLNGKLNTSGGTINSSDTNPLVINSTSGTQSGLPMTVNGVAKGWFGWEKDSVNIYNYASNKSLGILDDGTPYYGYGGNNHTLLHSGNVGEYNAGSATKLETARTIWGQSFDGTGDVWGNLNLHSDKLIFNSDAANYFIGCQGTTLATYNMYGGHSFCTEGGTQRMLINSSGNVLIGNANDDGSGAKLQVDGGISANYLVTVTGKGIFKGNYFGAFSPNDIVISGDKVRVFGDLYVDGNIIATKEVSAGGAGEEGGNAGGGGAFHSESIAVGATQTTIAHGLGTDDIVVSIYEKDGVSGRWSIILTDVEIVDANNIIVSFGSATNVEHKVVIMGAVA